MSLFFILAGTETVQKEEENKQSSNVKNMCELIGKHEIPKLDYNNSTNE